MQRHGFSDFMSAAERWRRDRRQSPRFLYAKVLSLIAGEEHDCLKCITGPSTCQPEHACCREFVLEHLTRMGWAQKKIDGKFEIHALHIPGKQQTHPSILQYDPLIVNMYTQQPLVQVGQK